jgi:nickel-dependent lactate racemase
MNTAIGRGDPATRLTEEQARRIVEQGIPASLVEGKRVLVLTPDATRTAPLPLMVRLINDWVGPRAKALDFMVALGTHQPLPDEKLFALFGLTPADREGPFARCRFLNHRWDRPDTLKKIGTLPASSVASITDGLFSEDVEVVINRAVYDYDLLLILGPVFPHEVVGFSGGNKYLFPGISGGDFVHFFHWLGAVITCGSTIGFKHTPVRAVVDKAAALVTVARHCLAMVVDGEGALAGLWAGTPEEAWEAAADLSARMHVVYKPRPFRTVLGRAPEMYDELWVAGKVMYKLEPVVADGGRLIIWGPHIKVISHTWGTHLERIGYHVRDYFLKQMDLFQGVPRGVLAHSTHVRGVGTFENGVEKPRIEVVLATAIPEWMCRQVNLGYLDPASIRPGEYAGREDEGVLFVDHAGEVLHRLESERERRA